MLYSRSLVSIMTSTCTNKLQLYFILNTLEIIRVYRLYHHLNNCQIGKRQQITMHVNKHVEFLNRCLSHSFDFSSTFFFEKLTGDFFLNNLMKIILLYQFTCRILYLRSGMWTNGKIRSAVGDQYDEEKKMGRKLSVYHCGKERL